MTTPVAAFRRTGLIVAAAAAGAMVLLGAATAFGPAAGWDLAAHRWVVQHRTATGTAIAAGVTTAGSTAVVFVALLGVVAAGTGWRRRDGERRRRALVLAAVLAGGWLMRLAVSGLVRRARPPQRDWAYPAHGYAWPSGHTTVSAIGACLLLWWLIGDLRGRAIRRFAGLLTGVYVAGVGLSRIYLGVHWPSDVLAGWLMALCWLALAAGLVPGVARASTAKAPHSDAPGDDDSEMSTRP